MFWLNTAKTLVFAVFFYQYHLKVNSPIFAAHKNFETLTVCNLKV